MAAPRACLPPTHSLVAAFMLPLAGLLGWTLLAASRPALPPGGRNYSVKEVYDHLHRQPAAWVGRTVQVRGQYGVACESWSAPDAHCLIWGVGLVDPGPPAQHLVLPLAAAESPPVVAAIRRLPLVGLLAPRQAPVLGRIAVYRVGLQTVLCGPPPDCLYQGVLVDAAPGDLGEG